MINPFRIHGAVTGGYFTNRAVEIKRIAQTLREPSAKLLVFGERRVGKTSTLLAAIERVRAKRGTAFLVDLSTASNVSDVATRVLEGASQGLGRGWKDFADAIGRHVRATLSVRPDADTGLLIPSLQIDTRRAELGGRAPTPGHAHDALAVLARREKTTIGGVLDAGQALAARGW